MCLVWPSTWGLTLGWHKKEERVVYLSTVFCTGWQGLHFIFLNIDINLPWRAVAFCCRLYSSGILLQIVQQWHFVTDCTAVAFCYRLYSSGILLQIVQQWYFATDCTAVAFCYRLYNWNWNCYWAVPALFKIMYLFVNYCNEHVSYYFVHETFVFSMWPVSHALWVSTFCRVQLLKTATCHKFSHFWKAVLFLVGYSIVCV
jgi:hypothetical protein